MSQIVIGSSNECVHKQVSLNQVEDQLAHDDGAQQTAVYQEGLTVIVIVALYRSVIRAGHGFDQCEAHSLSCSSFVVKPLDGGVFHSSGSELGDVTQLPLLGFQALHDAQIPIA